MNIIDDPNDIPPVAKPVERLLSRLDHVKGQAPQWTAQCPAHQDDSKNSLSIGEASDGRALVKCHAGCETGKVLDAVGLNTRDLFPAEPAQSCNRKAPGEGLTLAKYAESKQLPEPELRQFGLQDRLFAGCKAVVIPYFDNAGQVAAERFRMSPDGPDKFRWKKGSKPCLYGLNRKPASGPVTLAEGESDCHTLWHYGRPALGIPGASNWKESWATELEGLDPIYLWIEPDKGGQMLIETFGKSSLRSRVWLVNEPGVKDPSELHLTDPEHFEERLDAASSRAVSLDAHLAELEKQQHSELHEQAGPLLQEKDLLGAFSRDLERHGVAGEVRAAMLVFLCVISRLLERPVSVVLKACSSSGKSYLLAKVLDFFPASAFYALTAFSEKVLAYSEEPLQHRMLVIYEAKGMDGDMASYLVRSLLSEGRIRYEFVEKTATGLNARLIEREGPTGLIATTTATSLHPENETRFFSISIADDPEQTRRILRKQAQLSHGVEAGAANLEPWKALQTILEASDNRVDIPFADTLAELVPDKAVRVRRDFPAVLSLIKAHAVLHQFTRQRDTQGRIVATLDDYDAVRDLVDSLLAEGIDAGVSPAMRATVKAVAVLEDPVTSTAVAQHLKLDKSAAWRRVKSCLSRGFLVNEEERKGRPARLKLGDPMPDGDSVLPDRTALEGAVCNRPATTVATTQVENLQRFTGDGCSIAPVSGSDQVRIF